MSQLDGIDFLDVINPLLNCHIDFSVVNRLFLYFNQCVKLMFLNNPDSVMNSHIKLVHVLLWMQVSPDV